LFGRRIDDGRGLLDGRIDPGAVDVELHAVDHRKPLVFRAIEGGTVRSAGILARKPGELNPPYAGCRTAVRAGSIGAGAPDAARRLPQGLYKKSRKQPHAK